MPRQRKKLYVLDTNVLLHDPYALLRFEDNNVVIPFIVLEELDKHKSGQQDINRNARAAIRLLEQATHQPGSFEKGFSLKKLHDTGATGSMLIQHQVDSSSEVTLDLKKADNLLLNALQTLKAAHPSTPVILVSKDINLRVKARVLGFTAEDYLHDQAIEDADLLYRGYRELSGDALGQLLYDEESVWSDRGTAVYKLKQAKPAFLLNEFVTLGDGTTLRVHEVGSDYALLRQTNARSQVWGIEALNDEQSHALSLLLDPDIDFVTLLGPAGTGKTLLTLAAALHQTAEVERYSEIIFTRATVPLGDDIGFLPGGEEDKMRAWMGALDDNLEFLAERAVKLKKWEKASLDELKELVKVRAITFMRGRTFHKKFVVIDEAQNLTPKQIKALVTRSGPGTKVVCMGNLTQIDTPYLSETSSGLTYAVEAFKGWQHFGHLILAKGERSRLANYANENF